MKTLLWATLISIAMICPLAASGAIYKCQTSDGGTEFRDYPCDDGESTPMDLSYDQPEPAKKKTTTRIKRADTATETKKSTAKKSTSKPDERELKAGERRFIREGMTQAEVYARIGAPKTRAKGECVERFTVSKKNQIKATKSDCESCWDYPPAPADPQTRTRVCFRSDKVSSVHRLVER